MKKFKRLMAQLIPGFYFLDKILDNILTLQALLAISHTWLAIGEIGEIVSDAGKTITSI